MAEDKKGFVLYADQKDLFEQLPNEKAGELIKFIFSYVNDENPITEDLILNLAFTPIKQQLKRDLIKYNESKAKKSISGREGNLKRWNLDLYTEYKKGTYTLKGAESIAEGRKASQPDKVPSQGIANIAVKDTVNDTVTDINNNNNAPSVKKPKPTIDFIKLLEFINTTQKREGKDKFKVINKSVKGKYNARFKDGYTPEQIANSIINSAEDKYHKETNYKYLTPEFFSRSEMIDKHGFKTIASASKISVEKYASNDYGTFEQIKNQ